MPRSTTGCLPSMSAPHGSNGEDSKHNLTYSGRIDMNTPPRPLSQPVQPTVSDARGDAYKWAYEYLQNRMETLGRDGWAHDCDGEIESRIAAARALPAPVVSPDPVGVVIGFTDEGEAIVDHACEGGTSLEIGDCLYPSPQGAPALPGIRVTRIELTPQQRESLTCKSDVFIPGVASTATTKE